MTMIRNRTTALVFLALAVGLAVGFAWWAIFVKNTVDAAEQLSSACVQTEAQESFDFRSAVRTPKWGEGNEVVLKTTTIDVRISGEDYHLVMTGGGEPDSEAIGVDGVNYIRNADGEWELEKHGIVNIGWVLRLMNSKLHDVSGSTLCPTGGAAVRHVGARTLGGATAQLYTASETPKVPPGDPPAYVSRRTWDYWVGTDNLLRQVEQDVTLSTGYTQEFRTTISGVGEPNVITAPVVQ